VIKTKQQMKKGQRAMLQGYVKLARKTAAVLRGESNKLNTDLTIDNNWRVKKNNKQD